MIPFPASLFRGQAFSFVLALSLLSLTSDGVAKIYILGMFISNGDFRVQPHHLAALYLYTSLTTSGHRFTYDTENENGL